MASKLLEHAKHELKLAGFYKPDADYSGTSAQHVLELIALFASQGHSGTSAAVVRALFDALSQFKALSPVTANPDEWQDVSQYGPEPLWQNLRDSSYFSKDGGKTWYCIDDAVNV